MIILVSGATRTVDRLHSDRIGRLVSPQCGNSIDVVAASGQSWAADNGAFTGWNEAKFRRMLGRIANVDRSRFLWVAIPDVVADAEATIARWSDWSSEIGRLDLPAAFVGQDGIELIRDRIPWSEMTAFFIGGSTEWKLSASAEELAREAKSRGKWVHMGRVNSQRRARHAHEIGCDSIDGRTFSAWPDRYIPKGIQWTERLDQQRSLF